MEGAPLARELGPEGGRQPVAVVTAGGTREPVDEVRHLANVATGALPCAIAEALMARGWRVEYIHGPDACLPGYGRPNIDVTSADWKARWHEQELRLERLARRIAHGRVHLHPIATAAQAAETLAAVCRAAQPQLTLCAMAVADFAPEARTGKIQSRRDLAGPVDAADGGRSVRDQLVVTMLPTAKAIDRVKEVAPATRLVGFKLLAGADEEALLAASAHLASRASADVVFANDIQDYRRGQRSGLLVLPGGVVLARLDAGRGEDATARLAELIVQGVSRGIGVDAAALDGPTRRIERR